MRKILIITLLCLIANNPSHGKMCETPKNPKSLDVKAPKIIENKRTFNNSRIETILSNRKTINVFRAWQYKKPAFLYSLYWSGGDTAKPRINNNSFALREFYWAYYYPNQKWLNYPGIDKFLSKKSWGAPSWEEYGETVHINYTNPNFTNYFVNLIKNWTKDHDGVMFDLWKDNHKHYKGQSKNIVKEYRRKIAQSIRDEMGNDFIILGNVNWEMENHTHDLINGVFLELYKDKKTGYSCSEIKKIEKVINYHEENLSYPKLIAVNTWKISKKNINSSSPENIKFAKLFTAMAMVIPENGYILYGDNNFDHKDNDHDHIFYNFYNIDLGKPVSVGIKIAEGLGYKKYEKGLIIYNRTKFKYNIKFMNGKKIEVNPLEGMFVRN